MQELEFSKIEKTIESMMIETDPLDEYVDGYNEGLCAALKVFATIPSGSTTKNEMFDYIVDQRLCRVVDFALTGEDEYIVKV